MLDWLSSKFAMILASMLILSSAFTLIDIQRNGLEDFELKLIAHKISSCVNYIVFTNAEMKLTIAFDKSKGNVLLPTKVGGKEYSINITRSSVIVSQDSKRFLSQLTTLVHLWNPSESRPQNKIQLKEMDKTSNFLIFGSGSSIIVERKRLMMEDNNEFHTFIYEE